MHVEVPRLAFINPVEKIRRVQDGPLIEPEFVPIQELSFEE